MYPKKITGSMDTLDAAKKKIKSLNLVENFKKEKVDNVENNKNERSWAISISDINSILSKNLAD